jgi:hypothetical protein
VDIEKRNCKACIMNAAGSIAKESESKAETFIPCIPIPISMYRCRLAQILDILQILECCKPEAKISRLPPFSVELLLTNVKT